MIGNMANKPTKRMAAYEKADKASDRKAGIRENSRRDKASDAKGMKPSKRGC